MRLDGYDVFFLTGTDEHGIKMLQTAAKEKLSRRSELVERNVPRFQAMVERLNCSNDEFIRTTEERHHRASVGDLAADGGEQATSISTSIPAGTRCATKPITTRDETKLDDKGERIGPQGTPVEWVEEESYFFSLSAYQEKLLDLYASIPISCCRRSDSTRSRASCAAA